MSSTGKTVDKLKVLRDNKYPDLVDNQFDEDAALDTFVGVKN